MKKGKTSGNKLQKDVLKMYLESFFSMTCNSDEFLIRQETRKYFRLIDFF